MKTRLITPEAYVDTPKLTDVVVQYSVPPELAYAGLGGPGELVRVHGAPGSAMWPVRLLGRPDLGCRWSLRAREADLADPIDRIALVIGDRWADPLYHAVTFDFDCLKTLQTVTSGKTPPTALAYRSGPWRVLSISVPELPEGARETVVGFVLYPRSGYHPPAGTVIADRVFEQNHSSNYIATSTARQNG